MAEDPGSKDRGEDARSKQEEERRREAVKLYYDHLKHLTTLAVATAVVELAIYRVRLAETLDPWFLGFSLLCLAVCVVLCLSTMADVIFDVEYGAGPGTTTPVHALFYCGLGFFMINALAVPRWVVFLFLAGIVLQIVFGIIDEL